MTAHAKLFDAHAQAVAHQVGFQRLPTNTTTNNHPIHRWFNFIAGFSPEFVGACISMREAQSSATPLLLDPFLGCGTAVVAARLMGLAAIGYDPHPFFARISEAKANSSQYWSSLPRIRVAIQQGIAQPIAGEGILSPSAVTFLGKMFEPNSLASLLGARQVLEVEDLSNPLSFLILSRMLDHCCLAATDGIYKAPTSKKRALTPEAALERVIEVITRDGVEALAGHSLPKIYSKSSATMEEIKDTCVDLIVTSPPYLNNFDFAEMTRMYLYFWDMAESWGDISKKIRSKLIVNTTTALKGHRELQNVYRQSLPPLLLSAVDKAVRQLAVKRSLKAGKKEYDLLVYPYLSQMQTILRECLRVLRSGAPMHMMISDAALYGVHLPAPQWIAEIMSAVGFQDVDCHLVRPRGHRWILDKREGVECGLGEYYVFGRAA